MLEVVEHSADTAHQMYHMAVVLHILVELHLHIVAVAAQIVSGKVDEHHMLGILLWVVTQILCITRILFGISGSSSDSGYRVDICLAVLYSAVGLRR